MSLSATQLQQLAILARLDLPENNVEELSQKLNAIVDFFETLSDVNTDGVVPMAHPLDMTQRLRPDRVTESDHRELYQQNSAATEASVYLVPKVIE